MDPFVARSVPRVAMVGALIGVLAAAAALASCGSSSKGTGGGNASGDVSASGTGSGGTAATPPAGGATPTTPATTTPPPPTTPTPTPTTPPSTAFTPGQPGPWPLDNHSYGAAEGIQEFPVIAASADEAQNLWVATSQALYLMKPGDKSFTRFSSRDGLHLADNPLLYDEDYCGGEKHVPGAATWDGITTIVGGAANEVFVGYHGTAAVNGDCTDPAVDRHSGQLDRVRLKPDGTLDVTRFQMASTGFGMNFWHNRTVYRMVYDHVAHPHTLYAGTDHGVNMFLPDRWRAPNPGEWTGFSIQEWMSDHLHVQVCFHGDTTCLAGGEGNARMGDWRGLALAKDGNLWHAGRWSGGEIQWVADLTVWNKRSGQAAYPVAYGNGSAPVFPVANVGDVVSLSAVALAADGTPWFASSWFYGNGPAVSGPGTGLGLAHDRGNAKFEYVTPAQAGMTEQDVQDMVALPDGRLVLAGAHSGLVFWDPATGKSVKMRAGQGLPGDGVVQLELDTMVDPPTLRVATDGGVAVLRQFPK